MVVAEADRSKSLTRVAAMEATLEPLIRRALRRVVEEVVGAELPTSAEAERALVAALNPSGLQRLITRWQEEIDKTISPGFLKAIHQAQSWTLGRLPESVDVYLGPNIRDVRAQALLGTIRNRLVGVGDTLYQEASSALLSSLEQGEGVDKAAARVRQALDVSTARATVIARTEAAAVVNGADYTISQELADAGIAHTKEWLATNDPRTRESHAAANGQVVPVDQPFSVGGASLDYPGDPSGPADEVIQCRCTTLLDVEERETEALSAQASAEVAESVAAAPSSVFAAEELDVLDPAAKRTAGAITKSLSATKPGATLLADIKRFTETRGGVTNLRKTIDATKAGTASPALADRARTFVDAVNSFPREKVPTLYRGMAVKVTDTNEWWDAFEAGLKPGTRMTLNASSFSSSAKKAAEFSRSIGGTRSAGRNHTAVVFTLEDKAAALPVEQLSKFKSEKEWITGGEFEVTGYTQPTAKDPVYRVTIRQIKTLEA